MKKKLVVMQTSYMTWASTHNRAYKLSIQEEYSKTKHPQPQLQLDKETILCVLFGINIRKAIQLSRKVEAHLSVYAIHHEIIPMFINSQFLNKDIDLSWHGPLRYYL